jgi:hypothetical protein
MSFNPQIRVQHEQPQLPPTAQSTDPSPPETPPAPEVIVDYGNRLSRPGPVRTAFYFTNSLAAFWIIGFLRTRRLAVHQFLAENSHRLPTSDAGCVRPSHWRVSSSERGECSEEEGGN